MKLRLLVTRLLLGLALGTLAASASAQDFKALMRRTLDAWETLDPAKAAPFYAKEPGRTFYDIAPLKYTGWAEYEAGVKKLVGNWVSLKFTLQPDAQVERRGNLAWGTATLHADIVTKEGAKEPLDGRWTVVWEKQGENWLIVHEHTSMPIPAPPDQSKLSLYKRLGGYDALAAVTDDFIGRLAHDPELAHFFAGHSTASLQHIRQLIVDQLCTATGGPCVYIGQDMKTAHAGLGISESDWNASVNHLIETLDKFGVPKKEREEVLGLLSTLKKDIVAPNATK